MNHLTTPLNLEIKRHTSNILNTISCADIKMTKNEWFHQLNSLNIMNTIWASDLFVWTR